MEYPLFRTRRLPGAAKLPLPQHKLQTGLATLREALALQETLSKDFYTAVGADDGGYYVKAPDAATVDYLRNLEATGCADAVATESLIEALKL